MKADAVLFAGAHISSGRKPITFAALDNGLKVVQLAQWGIPELLTCLNAHEAVRLAINSPRSRTGHDIYMNLQAAIGSIGFEHYSQKNSARLWIESSAEECYRVFQPELFSRRTLEGRIQRGLILYEEGLQIHDSMEFFEEITRHKLMQGTLPSEGLYSTDQLDTLVMAYVAWLAGNPSEKLALKGNLYLPAPE